VVQLFEKFFLGMATALEFYLISRIYPVDDERLIFFFGLFFKLLMFSVHLPSLLAFLKLLLSVTGAGHCLGRVS
jgi:hypothetical protein